MILHIYIVKFIIYYISYNINLSFIFYLYYILSKFKNILYEIKKVNYYN